MSIEKKIDLWVKRGLIDEAAAGRIRSFEVQTSRPLLIPSLLTVGGFSILLGLIAIIAPTGK